jgi:hypothetical protein
MTDQRHVVGSFELRPDDNVAFNRAAKGSLVDTVFVCLWSVFTAVGFMGVFCLICVLVLSQFMSADEFREYVPGLPIGLWVASGMLYLWLLLRVANPYVLRRAFQRQSLGKRKRTIVISSLQIETEIGAMRSALPWSEVEKVVVTGTHIFLFLSSASALIAPVRAFASVEDAKRFGDDARAWHAAAKTA